MEKICGNNILINYELTYPSVCTENVLTIKEATHRCYWVLGAKVAYNVFQSFHNLQLDILYEPILVNLEKKNVQIYLLNFILFEDHYYKNSYLY